MENGLRTRIIFIRHGEAENNRLHIIGADMNLTEKGIKVIKYQTTEIAMLFKQKREKPTEPKQES